MHTQSRQLQNAPTSCHPFYWLSFFFFSPLPTCLAVHIQKLRVSHFFPALLASCLARNFRARHKIPSTVIQLGIELCTQYIPEQNELTKFPFYKNQRGTRYPNSGKCLMTFQIAKVTKCEMFYFTKLISNVLVILITCIGGNNV